MAQIKRKQTFYEQLSFPVQKKMSKVAAKAGSSKKESPAPAPAAAIVLENDEEEDSDPNSVQLDVNPYMIQTPVNNDEKEEPWMDPCCPILLASKTIKPDGSCILKMVGPKEKVLRILLLIIPAEVESIPDYTPYDICEILRDKMAPHCAQLTLPLKMAPADEFFELTQLAKNNLLLQLKGGDSHREIY